MQPTKEIIIGKLERILTEELTREQVVDWAMPIIEYDEIEVKDLEAWEFLKIVGGVDMIEYPDVYLYTLDDIRKWILDNSIL